MFDEVYGEHYRAICPILRRRPKEILKTAMLLFARYVDAATTFAGNCGSGGGASHDNDWDRDPKEDNIRWVRRCFHRAHELYTTPRKWRMRR